MRRLLNFSPFVQAMKPKKDSLKPYRDRRDFERTPEPEGKTLAGADKEPLFVVQKHQARTLHYDLRLEVNGVLKSWAVPKGPSLDPEAKRLAVVTEDHPMEYAHFEAIIPQGEYGGGTAIVWDVGTYHNLTEKKGTPVSMEEGLEHGHVKVELQGKKLKGAFSLNRFRTGKQEQWLLVKVNDEAAAPHRDLLTEMPESALTGRTIEKVAQGVEPKQKPPPSNIKRRT